MDISHQCDGRKNHELVDFVLAREFLKHSPDDHKSNLDVHFLTRPVTDAMMMVVVKNQPSNTCAQRYDRMHLPRREEASGVHNLDCPKSTSGRKFSSE